VSPFLGGYFFFSKNPNELIKSSQIGEKSPNMVTLLSFLIDEGAK
jgi:hypothetical protein